MRISQKADLFPRAKITGSVYVVLIFRFVRKDSVRGNENVKEGRNLQHLTLTLQYTKQNVFAKSKTKQKRKTGVWESQQHVHDKHTNKQKTTK